MVYPTEHYYLSFGGTLCQDEIWQCGMHFAPYANADISSNAFEEISLDDIFGDIRDWATRWDAHAGPGSAFSAQTSLEWCRLAVKGRDGLDKYPSRKFIPDEYVAGTATTPHAPQVAYVVTLWSGIKQRRANWGRFYVPMPVPAWSYVNGRMDQAYCDNLATGAKDMINAISGEVNTTLVPTYPCIISKVGAGEVKEIQKIGVGRVLDTQQRRRRKLDEAIVYADF